MKYLAGLLLLEPLILTGLIAFTSYEPHNGFMAYLFSILCLFFGFILGMKLHDKGEL